MQPHLSHSSPLRLELCHCLRNQRDVATAKKAPLPKERRPFQYRSWSGPPRWARVGYRSRSYTAGKKLERWLRPYTHVVRKGPS